MSNAEMIEVLLHSIKEVENSSASYKELSHSPHLPSDSVVFPDGARPENNAELMKLCVGTHFKGTILIPGMTEHKEDPERPQDYCLEILKEETDELGRKVGEAI
jgi:hypothetical protein